VTACFPRGSRASCVLEKNHDGGHSLLLPGTNPEAVRACRGIEKGFSEGWARRFLTLAICRIFVMDVREALDIAEEALSHGGPR
jgi:hypothetical protein